jgi:hypothetical protein
MKLVTYQCNLCDEKMDAQNAYRILYQYYCTSSVWPFKFELRTVTLSNTNECDRHICKNCITNIVQSNIEINR